MQVLLKSDKNNGYFNEDLCTLSYYLAELFLEWEIFQVNFVQKIKYISYSKNVS
jgi:hypothetical protein